MDAFWSGLVGAVVGALVGSSSSAYFAGQLRRSADRQQAKQALDSAIALVVTNLFAWQAASKAFEFGLVSRNEAQQETPHRAGGLAIASLRVAEMTAAKHEREPLSAALRHIQSDNGSGIKFQGIVDALMSWRRGEMTAADAATSINAL